MMIGGGFGRMVLWWWFVGVWFIGSNARNLEQDAGLSSIM